MREIFIRRSVRQFDTRLIEEEKIEKILRAGMQAPSAKNQQPWEFIVVTDKAVLKEMSEFSPYAKMLPQAAAAVVVLSRTEGVSLDYSPQDLGAATENILLEAVSLGLGGVWMGCMPGRERMDFIARLLKIPDNILPFGVVALGYPLNEDANRFIDRYDPKRVHIGVYGGRNDG